ncbi:Peptidyl-prolyl cis-trans isomerase,mitochondrial [Wickerhamomyces ciferrii]|uniref:Peptidyl-prolyl cis-trans isomerase,mitochondrial n=1 Tax=Wickerhamomyces ciferrii (strain ATCC 14091 / BCRC 22168 / CBS 111 / JCM 3599 / NBRC 0793 / NRRL Y-1031 F-60-10) TaxID=1206466 RepID=K0KUE9_WICCF|nr:Peptidyl-prolyl cis-trans isomerase,mitochondrial [Wickerhamomyces ciferrii]CCH46781.1 Peptidyl-prolyl cis-trans isomerase,mitochondrial [Wickerhamomyces ciferrii]
MINFDAQKRFIDLATGKNGVSYEGTTLHGETPDYLFDTLAGGKIDDGDMEKIPIDGRFGMPPLRPGVLYMRNDGSGQIGSEFILAFQSTPFFRNHHVAIGLFAFKYYDDPPEAGRQTYVNGEDVLNYFKHKLEGPNAKLLTITGCGTL